MKKSSDDLRRWRHKRLAAMAVAALLVVLTSACTRNSRNPEYVREYLDDRTGLTITALAQPIVLAHTEPRISSTLRDYLYVGPLEINRMGKRSYYLWIGPFSTLAQPPMTINRITLNPETINADFDLQAADSNTAGLKTPPYILPLASTRSYYVQVSREILAALASAGSVTIETYGDSLKNVYTLWNADEQALHRFADAVNIATTNN